MPVKIVRPVQREQGDGPASAPRPGAVGQVAGRCPSLAARITAAESGCYPVVAMHRVVVLLAFAGLAFAQPVQYLESKKVFLLTSRQSSYALGIAADGALRHLYWGAPLWRTDDLPRRAQRRDISCFDPRQMLEAEEFPGWGGPRYYEPALKITRDERQSRPGPPLRVAPHHRQRSRYRPARHQRPDRGHAPLPRLSRARHPAPQRHDPQRARTRALTRGERAIGHLEPARRAKAISSPTSPAAGRPRPR